MSRWMLGLSYYSISWYYSLELFHGSYKRQGVGQSVCFCVDSFSDGEEGEFDYLATVLSFVKVGRQVLLWEDSADDQPKGRNMRKEICGFPFMYEIKEIISDEWSPVEKTNFITIF